MNLERRYRNIPVQLKTREEGESTGTVGLLTGYIAVFNEDSLPLPPGDYVEQIAPGAFTETLKTRDQVALLNHDHNVVLGRKSAGTLRLEEDETGLRFELDLPDTQAGRDLRVLVERGDLKGCSFGFCVDKETWSQRDDVDFCLLEQIDLYEVSVGVTFPAYEQTTSEIRSRREKRRSNLKARDAARLKLALLV